MNSAYRFVKVEREGHLLLVTLNRPEVMNALHPPAHQELQRVFDAFAADPALWVAILTGAGDKAFSAGNDLKYQAEHGGARIREEMRDVSGGFGGLTRRIGLTKPLIAAVNGFALGGGFELALACDILIAAEGATFCLPEPRVGLMAAAGGVHRLPRHLPYHAAMGMLLTGRRMTAAEALQRGLVNEVVPRVELLATARRWAAEILECSPLSIRATKEAANRGLDMPLEEALAAVMPGQTAMIASEDFVEGPRAFAEKRKPVWKGR
jgi:crotonobetainyl-CoA hydratase